MRHGAMVLAPMITADFFYEMNSFLLLIASKDSYDFTDKPGDVSQYLGHWSSKGVIVVPYDGLVGQLNAPSLYLPYPVARGDMRVKGNVYYPVHNKDLRQWAMKHQRGGDFIIFSDRKRVRLREPIRIKL
ncbi:DUF6402 family protein [Paraburkholderia sp. A3BS-1L]|uniref:DUF6402 family protein n=1 Tax=Paraburkholderia sp. A3BS-1L TaxID=3028375 RepID=UPI003DA8FAD3